MALTERERIEIEYWRTSPYENPSRFSVENLVHKMSNAAVFLRKMREYDSYFQNAHTIVEIGAGQGWASCLLKKSLPSAAVFASDISPYAVASVPHWERVFDVRIDGAFSCLSHQIALPDDSVNLVFGFASMHHFGAQEPALAEIRRVLKKNGVALLLHEPCCRRYIRPWAVKRANRVRPAVPEDVIVFPEFLQTARRMGFAQVAMHFAPLVEGRGPLETIYYLILNKTPFLQQVLPCSSDFLLVK